MSTKDTAYWRDIVASAATVERALITQFSPDGFAKALGSTNGTWFYVKLGPLVLGRDGWMWQHVPTRDEPLEERLKYAYRTEAEALAALRVEVAPDEPVCSELIEKRQG